MRQLVIAALLAILVPLPPAIAQPEGKGCPECHAGVYPLPELVPPSCECHDVPPRGHTRIRAPDPRLEQVHEVHADLGVGLLISPGCKRCHVIPSTDCTRCHENPHPEERARELPCSECHAPLPSWSYHGVVEVGGRHAAGGLKCTTCHNVSAPAQLYLVSNGSAAEDAPQLCWQCHPREYRLWSEGRHFSNASCTSEGCHDPHNPALSALPVSPLALLRSLLASLAVFFGIFIASFRVYWVRRWLASRATTRRPA